ncbi:MAG: 3-dehydroquinate synthase [Candidatus Neomarinimicrobiota bacterium]
METISVELAARSYPIWIEDGLLKKLPQLLTDADGAKVVVITQPALTTRYGRKLVADLNQSRFSAMLIEVPAGEKAKTLEQVEGLYRQLLELRCDRATLLLALGGGTVGDLTGFVAATFLRGIAYLQVPTTLLAMVDSAIGGKTGVNLPQGKNLVGTIYQPRAVAVDPTVLATLPPRELVSGLAEVLKYGAIADREFFDLLSANLPLLLAGRDGELLTRVIRRSAAIKAAVIAEDEHENDRRRILNFGHTIGHALEKLAGYGYLTHGEAVAFGMVAAGFISNRRGLLSTDGWRSLETTIRRLPLPVLSQQDPNQVHETLRHDKKVRAGKLHFVLLQRLGQAVIVDDISDREISAALEVL